MKALEKGFKEGKALGKDVNKIPRFEDGDRTKHYGKGFIVVKSPEISRGC